jgi:GntR family transcriptional regulator/MocR family aminotransferase
VARTKPRASVVEDILVVLRRGGDEPLHRQIEGSIRDLVRSRRLAAGTSVPSTRALAASLGVSRGVVVEAYRQLVAEGYLVSSQGGYTRVAQLSAPPVRREAAPARVVPEVDFGYGRADAQSFPRAVWLRSLRRVLTEVPHDRLVYLEGRGATELRAAMCDYLNRARGTQATPDNMVITSGYAQAVSLLIPVLAARGARTVAVEDPSVDDDVRPVAAAAGLDVVGIPVGDEGIETDALGEADLLAVTPSHQWPTGGVLGPVGRTRVVQWAEERGALVLEDDYDAEFRYDRTPVGALQGLAPDRVAYSGTVSKTMAPALRLGWLVLPDDLVDAVAEAKLLADRGTATIDQLAFADFVDRGQFDRHLRRMRPIYRRRRDALVAALGRRLPDLEIAGAAAGLHLVLWLPDGIEEDAVVAAAAERGVRVAGVGPYRLTTGRPGLILGYASLGEGALARGVDLFADAMAAVRG